MYQVYAQLIALATTLAIAIGGGLLTGKTLKIDQKSIIDEESFRDDLQMIENI